MNRNDSSLTGETPALQMKEPCTAFACITLCSDLYFNSDFNVKLAEAYQSNIICLCTYCPSLGALYACA